MLKTTLLIIQLNSAIAPAMDAGASIYTNRWVNIVETNPLLRRADGTSDPFRTILLKGSGSVLLISAVQLVKHFKREDYPLAIGILAFVISVNVFDYKHAHDALTLPRGMRR